MTANSKRHLPAEVLNHLLAHHLLLGCSSQGFSFALLRKIFKSDRWNYQTAALDTLNHIQGLQMTVLLYLVTPNKNCELVEGGIQGVYITRLLWQTTTLYLFGLLAWPAQ